MWAKTFLQFSFLLSSFISLEGRGCFNEGMSWTGDFLLEITLHIGNVSACLDLCKKTADCQAFTWMNKDHHLFPESCVTYSDIGELETCEECTSGRLADCQLCSQPVGCQIDQNFIAAVSTTTEVDCQHVCALTTNCTFYTWVDSSEFLNNMCFLLSSCEDTVECTGCSSGPPSCQEDFCEGIEYRLLDDPTRNEKHGK